jgi:hypothetical protein
MPVNPTIKYAIGHTVVLDSIKYAVFSVSPVGIYLHVEPQESTQSEILAQYYEDKGLGSSSHSDPERIDKAQQWFSKSVLRTTHKDKQGVADEEIK